MADMVSNLSPGNFFKNSFFGEKSDKTAIFQCLNTFFYLVNTLEDSLREYLGMMRLLVYQLFPPLLAVLFVWLDIPVLLCFVWLMEFMCTVLGVLLLAWFHSI